MDDSIGRPARDESDSFYYPYIDSVPDGDILAILEEQRVETLSLFESIAESRAGYRYAPDKWSVSELVSHINDAERLYTMRAFWFARGMDTPLPTYHSDLAVQTAKGGERAWPTHVHEFGAIRASTIELFRNLPSEAWPRRGRASDYEFTVRALAYIAAGHVNHHVRVLKERYL
jgi:DinB family protein